MAGSEKNENNQIISIHSANPLDLEDHEIDLWAVTSNPVSIGEVGTSLSNEQKDLILKRVHLNGLLSVEDLPPAAVFYIQKVESLSTKDAVAILQDAILEFRDDINIPTPDYELLERLVESYDGKNYNVKEKLQSNFDNQKASFEETAHESDFHKIVDWDLQVRLEAVLIAYHSPYPQVRAVTDPFDDPTIPVETVRVYIAGIIWTAIGAVINQFFSQRQPAIELSSSVVQIFLYPTGVALQYILPKWRFKVWKYTIDLNPGPWSHKEQMLATLFYSVSGGTSYVSSYIHVQKMKIFYDNQWANFGFQTLLILSNNFLGFGFAGIFRKFFVYPVEALWPTLLPTVALNRALTVSEKKESINGWVISKYTFFFITFASSFVYFWIPTYLFQALSYFNWMTWIKPDNFNLAAVTGSLSGLGLNPVPTFDINTILDNAALIIPFYTQFSSYIGSILSFFCIIAVYYSNYKWTAYLPINSNGLFTNTGHPYKVTAILDENSLLDHKKYQEYGPPFYSASNLVSYGAIFALYPFAIVFEIGRSYKQVWKAIKDVILGFKSLRRSNFEGFNDPHSKMMTAYKEVPDWIFLVVLVISLVLAIICVEVYPAQTPVWGIFFALGINFVFLIPINSIASRTGFSFGLNALVELIVGYALPGNGLALMFIKAFGYNIDGQAQNYITDQKMAHYVKIPPRALFRAQIISVFIASFIQLGIMNFQMNGGIDNYCDPHNKQKFTCPGTRTYYSASVIWGVIGPKKVFNGLYPILQYCFLIGFLLAIPCLAVKWYGPRKYTKYFEPSIIIGGFRIWAPYNLTHITAGLYVSIVFMHYIKKKYEGWWQKYDYILSTGLTSGIAFSSIIIFFAVQYHHKSLSWWGNDVPFLGVDGGYFTLLNAKERAPDGYFGPRVGHFP
ncbi:OPT oligopeptide transporter protein-domain-containing protein [Scheffersomyces xylosifermentans]|uniref:OPT oligopeptide transporter protein-domain-containing protein n=1 Tax=Scheffersomyces xylosifermentans TaxID=1304137 RepID=UPI00315DF07D